MKHLITLLILVLRVNIIEVDRLVPFLVFLLGVDVVEVDIPGRFIGSLDGTLLLCVDVVEVNFVAVDRDGCSGDGAEQKGEGNAGGAGEAHGDVVIGIRRLVM